ncbi:MAG TPA: M20/M25/M40 family metallo-hydrolase [Patescibacteria group bacterium]|nr:M20/M25/M40 family metallo-hydrolase [Patescibacteria group bacterium]
MNNFNQYKKLLKEFVAFKSVSTDPKFLPEIGKTVEWLKNLLTKNGFMVEIWKGKSCNSVVFAQQTFTDNSLPTLLIYGHYDVQPAEKSDGWKSEPFDLVEEKGKLIGRGAADNKGQILAHIVTAINLLKDKKLAYNVKFLIEGNEETSNPDLAVLMKVNKKKLACDILMVSDGELTNDKPTIEISLRGGFNCTLNFKTGKNNLHSGLAGGAVPNAAIELNKFLGKLYMPDGSISFKDFYKNIDRVDKSQLENNKKLQSEAKNISKLMGVKTLLLQKSKDFFTQTGLNSTIQITGIKTGYIDTGYANIVPAEAEVRLNFRIVASQKAQDVANDFKKFVKANTPKYVEYLLSFNGLHNPIKVNTNNQYVTAAEKMLEKVYGTRVNRKNVGGAIPFVGDVKQILGIDTLLIPFVNEDCNMHGTQENFDTKLAKKALDFSKVFMSHSISFYLPRWKTKNNVVKGQT